MIFFLLLLCLPLFGDELDSSIVSVYAIDMQTGEILIDENSHLSLNPASCLKLLTTAAALHILGGDFRFQTHLEHDGVIDKNGVLHGNLYVRGGGDPCLGSDRIAGNLRWNEVIELLANKVRSTPIVRIDGEVIADSTLWETARAIPSWEWEDIGNYYGSGPCALSFHENAYSLTFEPGKKEGDLARIVRTDPPLDLHSFENHVTTGPAGSGDRACIYGSELAAIQRVSGTIPRAVPEFTIKGALPNPPALMVQLLKKELQKQGVSLDSHSLPSLKVRSPLLTLNSPSLSTIVHATHQHSINLYAEHLLRAIGNGSTSGGIQAITHFLDKLEIEKTGLLLADGSGLSRKNLITTKQLVSLLSKMHASSLFVHSLPEIRKGVVAKSGSASLTRGCSGYVGRIAFAILINHCKNSAIAEQKIQATLSQLINYKRL
jgi:D-alanyl-D-alanine carboxypeptidase/D-alanyl-D-alanine-endopeptidase (penicillin-binding protein 4)